VFVHKSDIPINISCYQGFIRYFNVLFCFDKLESESYKHPETTEIGLEKYPVCSWIHNCGGIHIRGIVDNNNNSVDDDDENVDDDMDNNNNGDDDCDDDHHHEIIQIMITLLMMMMKMSMMIWIIIIVMMMVVMMMMTIMK